MTPEALSITTGSILSLLFNYFPGLRQWFDGLSSNTKGLAMAAMTGIIAIGITFWSCSDPVNAKKGIGICLSGVNWWSFIMTWFLTLGPNQAVHRVSPKVDEEDSNT